MVTRKPAVFEHAVKWLTPRSMVKKEGNGARELVWSQSSLYNPAHLSINVTTFILLSCNRTILNAFLSQGRSLPATISHTTMLPTLVPVRTLLDFGWNTDWLNRPTTLLKSWENPKRNIQSYCSFFYSKHTRLSFTTVMAAIRSWMAVALFKISSRCRKVDFCTSSVKGGAAWSTRSSSWKNRSSRKIKWKKLYCIFCTFQYTTYSHLATLLGDISSCKTFYKPVIYCRLEILCSVAEEYGTSINLPRNRKQPCRCCYWPVDDNLPCWMQCNPKVQQFYKV